jgi:hypothetical protein
MLRQTRGLIVLTGLALVALGVACGMKGAPRPPEPPPPPTTETQPPMDPPRGPIEPSGGPGSSPDAGP